MAERQTIDSSVHQRRFLECFAACGGSVLRAARWAKLSRNAHYNWLTEDPTYRPRYEAAQQRAAQTLEDEAIRRAREGIRKPIFHKGKVVGYVNEYSDSLMQTLLKASNRARFGDKTDLALSGDITVKRLIGVNVDDV
jgi:hypothetical protein